MNLSKLRETVKDRGAWRAAVHGTAKSWTWLSNWTATAICLIECGRGQSFFSQKNLEDPTITKWNQVIRINIISNKSCWFHVLPDMIWEGNFHLFDILLQKLDSQSSHEETSDKLKLGHILQMPNQDFSKVSFVKDKERLRNCHRWEEMKETRQLNVICYPGLDPGTENGWNLCKICTLVNESESHSVMSNSLRPHGLYSPWNSPGQNAGVGSLSLLQGIFPTQGSNPGLLHSGQILYQLSHQGIPRILEWVACAFSSRSSRPSNPTGVSSIAGGFFTSWAPREA